MNLNRSKEPYITPECDVLIIQPEGVIAASPKYPDSPFGDEQQWSS